MVALVNAANGTETARYEYGPFGEPIRVTGPAAALNPFRFSTKRTDPTTDLVLYEYRAYSPTFGRWMSRDPIGESGSEGLYAFVLNCPTSLTDSVGLACTVEFNCLLFSSSPSGACNMQCDYVCYEIGRILSAGGTLQCDELRANLTITSATIALGNWLCRLTGGRCGRRGVCERSYQTTRLYGVIADLPSRRCSRTDCRRKCDLAYNLEMEVCKRLAGVARLTCEAAAKAARQLCYDTCNSWCLNP